MLKYSERPKTAAEKKYNDDVEEEIKQKRLVEIINLQQAQSLENNKKRLNKTYEVLIEGYSKRSKNHYSGRTTHNCVVVFEKGKQKADLIKRWVKASNKFLLKMKKKIKDSFEDNINNPKITKFMSKYGYNELLVYDVKVKDAYIVIDVLGDPNDFEATEKVLKQIKKDLKPFVKGKIYQGFADGVKKFVKQRGGKV